MMKPKVVQALLPLVLLAGHGAVEAAPPTRAACAPNIGSGGYLGSSYAPVFIGSADNHPTMPKFRLPEIYDTANPDRLQERRKLLDSLESDRLAQNPLAKDWGELRELAYDAMTRPASPFRTDDWL